VTEEVAMEYASSPHDFKLMVASSGKNASDIDQLLSDPREEVEPAPEPVAPVNGSTNGSANAGTEPRTEQPTPAAAPTASGEPAGPIDYGSPEHAFGRSAAPAPAPEPESAAPPPAPQPGGGKDDEDAEYGADEVGLGSAEYAEIWERQASDSEPRG
jgi:hypothetical protein